MKLNKKGLKEKPNFAELRKQIRHREDAPDAPEVEAQKKAAKNPLKKAAEVK